MVITCTFEYQIKQTTTMKTFTEAQVDKMIREVVSESCAAFNQWIEKETIIVDKDSQEEIPNAELTVRKSEGRKTLTDYIHGAINKNTQVTFTRIQK